MKNLSLILNAILFVAVAVLFFLFFSSKKSTESSVKAPSDLKMAYINSDTVLKYYDYVKEMRTIYDAKNKRLDQDLKNRAQSLQNDIDSYQRNLSNLTIGQAKAVEEDLGKKQQNFRLYQQSVEQEVVNDQNKLTTELYTRITTFLKSYSEGSGLQVVFKFDPSSDVLYGDNAIDISQDVIKGLNEQYKNDKKPASANPDTTKAKVK
ncbi:MAG TPA: outer membrane chaperone Skp [Cytophagales bacterium]|jgi:outer membrane protein|nr:outer membrane chaperone Skp [Cytophagales bacterium]